MRPITPEFLDELIDFAPSGADRDKAFGRQQREGAVAAFNMLARNGCAYLADEVGMGKTYVALGVMSLMRYFDPHVRIVVIAPRRNIQHKWVKELHNFVSRNWRVAGNRVKTLDDGPVWTPVVCNSLIEFAHEALVNQDRDFFLRMTSFSVTLSDSETRRKRRNALLKTVPWRERPHVPYHNREGFRDAFAAALNCAVPEADLVIVDEAHNLKYGFRADGSTRNRVMGLAFGHPEHDGFGQPSWYTKKAKRVLFLSATPFEDDYAAIQRQLSIFGFGDAVLKGANGEAGANVALLANPEADDDEKRRVVRRLLIRRVSGINIAGKLHTKNMYRREWRRGGFEDIEEPIQIKDSRQRLIVALMQKKVAEVLQAERFNNHFQIGMLSSFESFLQSVETARHRKEKLEEEKSEDGRTFDGEEQHRGLSDRVRSGIDTEAIKAVVHSYRERFGRTLPHPKLDATAAALGDAFETGEKTLVFVRRVATVNELASKLDESFDKWIRARMEERLPRLRTEVATLFERYANERGQRPEEAETAREEDTDRSMEKERIDQRDDLEEEEDEGGAENFFAWFFRGNGPSGVLSGAALKKRLSSTNSAYSTLFEDDYVANLLGVEAGGVLDSLARLTGEAPERCKERLRRLAFNFCEGREGRKDSAKGYPRLHVSEGYQAAGLDLIRKVGGELGEQAAVVLDERFPYLRPISLENPPVGFPGHEAGLGLTTVFTELRRRPALRKRLWPEEVCEEFRATFRRREQRRRLLSPMTRLGAAYIDLYLLAIERIGSFDLRRRQETEPAADLARDFINLLERQEHEPGFHACRELAQAAEAFDHIVSANFPEAPSRPLQGLARLYGATLQKQVPVGQMSGGVNQRLVRQFRMPGFPLVLITTDVLQEGEDLHTFCRRIAHYGIAWTPSAMEQRTGRVDRIGGLVQRRLDGSREPPADEDLIQVYYPHLHDTVELLQVRRVLRRLDRFLRLIHRGDSAVEAEDGRAIDVDRAWHEEREDPPPIKGPLESAFPVEPDWLKGELGADAVTVPDWEFRYRHLDELWEGLCASYPITAQPSSKQKHLRHGEISVVAVASSGAGARLGTAKDGTQPFTIGLRSQVAGDETLIECESLIGWADLQDDVIVDALTAALDGGDAVKLCIDPRVGKNQDRIYVRRDLLFDPEATRLEDVRAMFESTVAAAVRLRSALEDAGLLGTI